MMSTRSFNWKSEKWNVDEAQPIRIDYFWSKVDAIRDAAGEKKFPLLMQVVKATIVLGHGNAEVERVIFGKR